MSDRVKVLLGINCVLPEGLPPYTPYKNSVKHPSDCCGEEVWLGPEQQKMLANTPGIRVICGLCAARHQLATGDKLEMTTLTDKKAGE